MRPPLVRRTIPWKTREIATVCTTPTIVKRIRPNANVRITALHNADIVRRAFLATILRVPEFKESLIRPLPVDAAFSVPGESHADSMKAWVEGMRFSVREVDVGSVLEHFEVRGYAVDGEGFREGAVVPEVDFEAGVVVAAFVGARVDEGVLGRVEGDGDCCGR